jgi:hypothetical protein
MTIPRTIICLILFPIIMYVWWYLLHSASENYGYLGLALTGAAILGGLVVTGKLLGVDFS